MYIDESQDSIKFWFKDTVSLPNYKTFYNKYFIFKYKTFYKFLNSIIILFSKYYQFINTINLS